MATVQRDATTVRIQTDRTVAVVNTEGYVSGVAGGSFVDQATGARDLGHGLMIADFLLEPGSDDESTPEALRYHWGDPHHGSLPKRYVELPQICTQAGRLPVEILCQRGAGFAAVRQRYTWAVARPPYQPGSTWEQCLVFPDGVRWFLAYDRVTSANSVEQLIFRMDMPGHLKHTGGDTFEQIYLSYRGALPASAFESDFAPDERYLYERNDRDLPGRYIRGYKTAGGPWLLGMALDPAAVYQAWCHQRGYVCLIHEIGGRRIAAGESFGAVHLIGFFDDLDEAAAVYDQHGSARALRLSDESWDLTA